MEIVFATEKLAKTMNADSKLSQTYGSKLATKIRARLDDLAAAETLEVMKTLPGRCEELGGDRRGQFSLRLDANWRLIFEQNDEPPAVKPDGGIDWSRVKSLKVIEVVDYH